METMISPNRGTKGSKCDSDFNYYFWCGIGLFTSFGTAAAMQIASVQCWHQAPNFEPSISSKGINGNTRLRLPSSSVFFVDRSVSQQQLEVVRSKPLCAWAEKKVCAEFDCVAGNRILRLCIFGRTMRCENWVLPKWSAITCFTPSFLYWCIALVRFRTPRRAEFYD